MSLKTRVQKIEGKSGENEAWNRVRYKCANCNQMASKLKEAVSLDWLTS